MYKISYKLISVGDGVPGAKQHSKGGFRRHEDAQAHLDRLKKKHKGKLRDVEVMKESQRLNRKQVRVLVEGALREAYPPEGEFSYGLVQDDLSQAKADIESAFDMLMGVQAAALEYGDPEMESVVGDEIAGIMDLLDDASVRIDKLAAGMEATAEVEVEQSGDYGEDY